MKNKTILTIAVILVLSLVVCVSASKYLQHTVTNEHPMPNNNDIVYNTPTEDGRDQFGATHQSTSIPTPITKE